MKRKIISLALSLSLLASCAAPAAETPTPESDILDDPDGLAYLYAQTILDSTQKTLQMGFTGNGGNPDALDIYYYMEGEKPLEIPNIGRTWPLDRPYAW